MDDQTKNTFNLCLRIVSAIIFSSLAVAMLVIGAMFIDDCPVNRLIPIYLLVAGSAHILIMPLVLLPIFMYCCCREKADAAVCVSMCFLVILMMFTLAWHITGSVWVFSLKEDDWNSKDSTADNYCHPTVYYFAFWQLLSTYIIAGIEFVVTCCIWCFASCFNR